MSRQEMLGKVVARERVEGILRNASEVLKVQSKGPTERLGRDLRRGRIRAVSLVFNMDNFLRRRRCNLGVLVWERHF